jgi:hypothetical protein
LLAPLSCMAAPCVCAYFREKRDGFDKGATQIEGLTTMDASESTIKPKPMGAGKSIALTMGTSNKLYLGHAGEHR